MAVDHSPISSRAPLLNISLHFFLYKRHPVGLAKGPAGQAIQVDATGHRLAPLILHPPMNADPLWQPAAGAGRPDIGLSTVPSSVRPLPVISPLATERSSDKVFYFSKLHQCQLPDTLNTQVHLEYSRFIQIIVK